MGRLAPDRTFPRNLLMRLVGSSAINVWMRRFLLNKWGARLADTAYVLPHCFFEGPDFEIGAGSFLNLGCHLDTYAHVAIGRGVWIGQHTVILTATHQPGTSEQRAGTPTGLPVVIGDGCWLGANVTVCPGVTVEPGCVIAAGAVVVKDCERDGLYGGVPARRLKDL